MTIRDFRLGWRLLIQQPGYSLMMIAGQAIGFAVFLLVLVFANYSFNYNSSVPKLAEVSVLKLRPNWGEGFWSEVAPLPLRDTLAHSGVPLQATNVLELSTAMRVGQSVQEVTLSLVDADFGAVFGLAAREGDLALALLRPDTLALSSETAKKLFGHAQALGQTVHINGAPFQVAAVLDEPADDSSVKFQALAGRASAAWSETERTKANALWSYYEDGVEGSVSNRIFVRTPGGAQRAQLAALLVDSVEHSPLRAHLTSKQLTALGSNKLLDITLGPLAESYLDDQARMNSGPKGDRTATFMMIAVALLILLLTVGNYVSLATIRTIARQREMAIRKVMGVSGQRLVAQMLAESMLVALLAAALGMLLAWLLLPAWSSMTGLQMASVLTPRDWVGLLLVGLAMGLMVGLGAGLNPAWTALKMRMLDVLGGRGNSETTGALLLRRIVTVLQFAIVMFATGMIVTIAWQIGFLKRIDFGYQIDALLDVRVPPDMTRFELTRFRDALARQPGIAGVAAGSPGAANTELRDAHGQAVQLGVLRVTPEYFATLGLAASLGRVFDPRLDPPEQADVIVVNALATAKLGFASPAAALGQLVSLQGRPVRIVGISRDVGRGFYHGPTRARVYQIDPLPSRIYVNGGADLTAAKASIETLWHAQFPNRYLYLSRERSEQDLNASGPLEILNVCILVAFIMVPLAVISIYILSAHAVQRRAREIVLRKLHGAGRDDIARLLGREFLALIAFAAVLGLPPAYLVGRLFIEQFAEQAAIGVWNLVAAFGGAVLVALLASTRHTLIATRMSPANALRDA